MAPPFTVAEIRQAFLDFFTAKGCTPAPSASLVPQNDPTTLFTVAGMSQFKEAFLGRGEWAFTRAATCQKCIRTNDILNVGRTPRHHTFFEMLGNFSFNDYFKREAIHWAWEFLTQVLCLDPQRLFVTVNHRDDEAWNIWQDEIGIPQRRMCRLGDDDNFWPASAPTQGPTGPGGNCSEIFWDFEPDGPADENPGNDPGNRFVEIWNLVFPQFNVCEPRVDGRYTLEELGRNNIDTGSGLERLACVVQGKRNNFDIDLLRGMVAHVAQIAGVDYVEGASDAQLEARNALLRRIADHIRAVTFCIADAALPGNTGRGYIVRRLLRRATLDIDKLGVEDCRLAEVVGTVVAAMADTYPEIALRQELAAQIIHSEEQAFRRTLRRGLDLFQRTLKRHQKAGASRFSGDDAFELFTTYGFPHEITAELAEAEGLLLDQERFDERMRAFADVSKGGKQVEVFQESALRDAQAALGKSHFVGYDTYSTDAQLLMLEQDGQGVDAVNEGGRLRFVLDHTPFYPESGGQVADQGAVQGDGFRISVDGVSKDGGLIVHHARVEEGTARPGSVQAYIDVAQREATARHHSATHLLHAALSEILGTHVEQQGSQVEAEGLRFDFTHDAALDDATIAKVEAWVQDAIQAQQPVSCTEMPLAEARASGAKALFGEKYGDIVRVVRMGSLSTELCGGCHVSNTQDIAAFRIVREEAVSAGIRRIHALAGPAAAALAGQEREIAAQLCSLLGGAVSKDPRRDLSALAQTFKVRIEELPERLSGQLAQAQELAQQLACGLELEGSDLLERVRSLTACSKQLRKQIEGQAASRAQAALDALASEPQICADIPLYALSLQGVDAKALRQAGERFTQRCASYLLVLASSLEDKVALVVAASPDVIERGCSAGAIVARLAAIVGGGGGGKAHFAQAGGKDPSAIPSLFSSLPALIEECCGVTTPTAKEQS